MAFVAQNISTLQETSEWKEIIEKDEELKTQILNNQCITSKARAFKSFVRKMFSVWAIKIIFKSVEIVVVINYH